MCFPWVIIVTRFCLYALTMKIVTRLCYSDHEQGNRKPTLQRTKPKVNIRTHTIVKPNTGLRKHWGTFTKFVENYKRQIFWLTLYILVTIGIFAERAYCKYNVFIYLLYPLSLSSLTGNKINATRVDI